MQHRHRCGLIINLVTVPKVFWEQAAYRFQREWTPPQRALATLPRPAMSCSRSRQAQAHICRSYATSYRIVLILHSGPAHLVKVPHPVGDLIGPPVSHLIRGSLGPREPTLQTASRPCEPFLHNSRLLATHRHTDHVTWAYNIFSNRPYICTACDAV